MILFLRSTMLEVITPKYQGTQLLGKGKFLGRNNNISNVVFYLVDEFKSLFQL